MRLNIQPLSTFLTADMPNVDIGNVTTGVVNISEAISKYGIAIVIMAVFFVIFMILIVIMLYSNTKMINQIISSKSASDQQEQNIISKFVDSALEAKGVSSKEEIVNTLSNELKESLTPINQRLEALSKMQEEGDHAKHTDDYHKNLVGAFIDINMIFKDVSRATLTSLGCDRIGIYVFHNGNQSTYGLPFFKMSCIHEWTVHGVNTMRGKSHIDLPLHLFNDFIENLYQFGYYCTENISDGMREDPSISQFTSYSGTKAIYLLAIKDDNEGIAGFVSAEFNHVERFESDELRGRQVRMILENMVAHVAPIVGNKHIFNRNKNINNN